MTAIPLLFRNRGNQAKEGAGRIGLEGARPIVNKTRVLIVQVMRELKDPATVEEIHGHLDGDTPLKNVEYHLSTLVECRIVKLVFGGPELRFRLITDAEESEIFKAVPVALTESKRTEPGGLRIKTKGRRQ